jgi:hypothetical protein
VKKNPVTHRAIFRHICENLDQDFDSPACREIRRHVEGCGDCVAYLDSLKTTVALYREYPAPGLSAAARRSLRAIFKVKK